MRICVYEDHRVHGLEPLSLTRPAADLICGLTTLAEKQARYFGTRTVGHLCRPLIAELIRSRGSSGGVNDPFWLRAGPTVLVNARWVPPPGRFVAAGPPYLGVVDGQIAFAVLAPAQLAAVSPATLDSCLSEWIRTLPLCEAGGQLIEHPWHLIALNAEQVVRDFEAEADPTAAGFHPTGFALVGPADRLFIHPAAKIDPMVVADTTHGPVVIGPDAVIHAFTRLEGPCAVGPGAVLLGATVRAGTTIGPHCRVGGEVEASVLLGYTNKYHEGFLGHSYIGEWVNLAAGTHTADLRCDYRPVTVPTDGKEMSTGQTKLGAIVGDHVKTGLGVLLDCGTVIGPFAQVLPTGGYAPREVPTCTRVGPSGNKQLNDTDRLLAIADRMMRRRGKELTPALEAVYRWVAAHHSDEIGIVPMRRSA